VRLGCLAVLSQVGVSSQPLMVNEYSALIERKLAGENQMACS
jgi:hypothetical protein